MYVPSMIPLCPLLSSVYIIIHRLKFIIRDGFSQEMVVCIPGRGFVVKVLFTDIVRVHFTLHTW